MAEEGASQEKTEEATPKRLRESRKKGQVAKSRDLNTVVILIAAFGLLAALISFWAHQTRLLLEGTLPIVSKADITKEELFQYGQLAFKTYLNVSFPYLVAIAFFALLVGFAQVGPIFSGEPIKFLFKRLNIVENLKNMFKVTTLFELFKNIVKVLLIFWIAYAVLKNNLRDLVATVTGELPASTQVASKIVISFMVRVFVLFAMLAILDVLVQRWHFKKQLRMTKEEVKREYKQDEGDPIIKSARRQLHQELAMTDVRQAVAMSDVVVTNPTELAIAIRYDEKEMIAPTIMAKGQRLFAEKIRNLAEEEEVPIMQNVPLAWSLIELDIGDEVSEELYQAVAEILVVVYRMKEKSETLNLKF